jgi:hypothetical protein
LNLFEFESKPPLSPITMAPGPHVLDPTCPVSCQQHSTASCPPTSATAGLLPAARRLSVGLGTSPHLIAAWHPLASHPSSATEARRLARTLKKRRHRLRLPDERRPWLFFCRLSVCLTSLITYPCYWTPPRLSPATGVPSSQPNATACRYLPLPHR